MKINETRKISFVISDHHLKILHYLNETRGRKEVRQAVFDDVVFILA